MWGSLIGGGEAQAGSQRTGRRKGQAESGWKEEHEQRLRERSLARNRMGWDGLEHQPPQTNSL